MVGKAKKLTARFYETATGRKPVREWLLELDLQDRRLIGFDIQTVEFGWPIGMPICRSLGNGVSEVRSDISNGRIARTIFCMLNGDMILLHGFIKKTQQTPRNELDLALARKKDLTQ